MKYKNKTLINKLILITLFQSSINYSWEYKNINHHDPLNIFFFFEQDKSPIPTICCFDNSFTRPKDFTWKPGYFTRDEGDSTLFGPHPHHMPHFYYTSTQTKKRPDYRLADACNPPKQPTYLYLFFSLQTMIHLWYGIKLPFFLFFF